ncbi:hypothetical protein H0H93_014789, partial [Arthromyces matolae]
MRYYGLRSASIALTVCLWQSFLWATVANGSIIVSRAPAGAKAVIAQMFEWTWDSIASECTNFLGPAGYGFVQ